MTLFGDGCFADIIMMRLQWTYIQWLVFVLEEEMTQTQRREMKRGRDWIRSHHRLEVGAGDMTQCRGEF